MTSRRGGKKKGSVTEKETENFRGRWRKNPSFLRRRRSIYIESRGKKRGEAKKGEGKMVEGERKTQDKK